MAFEGLSEKLNAAFKKLRGKGRLTEADVREGMREVRLALLEADVSYKVVKDFVAQVTERCVGADVLDSLTPGQQIVKIVNEELTALMGGSNARLTFASKGPTIVMMVGLQGAGKTTNGAKLAGLMRRQFGKRPLLVACDVYRPAAINQLQVVGKQLDIPVFEMGQADPVHIAEEAVKYARDHGNDMVFLDTAGRLHIDEALMDELKAIKAAVKPTEILLGVDAMTGPDAVNAASAFDGAGHRRCAAHQAGRRRPWRCSSLHPGGHRQAHQVRGYRREAGHDRAVPPGAHGLPDPGQGRYADLHREGGAAV